MLIVLLKEGADRDAWKAALIQAGYPFTELEALPRIFHVEAPLFDFPLRDHPAVKTVEPDRVFKGDADQAMTIDASLGGDNWGLARHIRRRRPWRIRPVELPVDTYYRNLRNGDGVDIYSFDSGTRLTSVEIAGRTTNVYEFYSSGGAGDDYGHGTATMALAAGNTIGMARAAEIRSFKMLDSGNSGSTSSLTSAISQALSDYNSRSGLNRPAVANMSLGGFSSAVSSAVTSLIDAGMCVCASAGNSFEDLGDSDQYPAESNANVIVVGGSCFDDHPYFQGRFGTSYGTRVDVVAASQSVRIIFADADDDYRIGSGTSYGCGIATGAVACLLQGHDRLSSAAEVGAVRDHLIATATAGQLVTTQSDGENTIQLPDRLLYLDPTITAPEAITGL